MVDSYVVPVPAPTGVVGVDVTGAFWNANVRDAVNFFGYRPTVSAFQSTVQSVANTTWTKLTPDTINVDSYGYWDATNHRYTPQRAGWYWVSVVSCWTSNGTGGRYGQVYKNGSPVRGISDSQPGSSSIAATCCATGPAYLNGSTDYIECWGWQNSGAALSTYSDANNASSLHAIWVHA